jgi:hypothetical protein
MVLLKVVWHITNIVSLENKREIQHGVDIFDGLFKNQQRSVLLA